jgi:hypothetical protein
MQAMSGSASSFTAKVRSARRHTIIERGYSHDALRCWRPGCGGRLFLVRVALDESALVCMLCSRGTLCDSIG